MAQAAVAAYRATRVAVVGLAAISSSAQKASNVDFGRDIQPILSTRCIQCHGPQMQSNGYRLDRRSSAFGGMVRSNIIPGSSESSRLIVRISGTGLERQMPPTGPLSAEEIDLLKQWIDEGANWPAELANEGEPIPMDEGAATFIKMIETGAGDALRQLEISPGIADRRGPEGATPLMHAALHGRTALVEAMLQRGADPNARNHAGATALLWAVEYPDVVRLLLQAGANPNASSNFGRTALAIAATQARSAAVVRLLLANGARPEDGALASAALRGDDENVRALLTAGARSTSTAIAAALRSGCKLCLAALESAPGSGDWKNSVLSQLPPAGTGDVHAVRQLLERGADPNIKDTRSRTALMLASALENTSPQLVQLLLDRGARVNEKSTDGSTALDFARRARNPVTVETLRTAGAIEGLSDRPARAPQPAPDILRAITRSLPLLQRSAATFHAKSGCVSCHHNTLTQVTLAAARKRGFTFDETSARRDVALTVAEMNRGLDQTLQGLAIPGGFVTTTAYVLIGLAAEQHPPDATTHAMVRLIRTTQRADGGWRSPYRPPLESSEFAATALCLRSLQLYGLADTAEGGARAVHAAAQWLAMAQPKTTEDVSFRLMGLAWAQQNSAKRAAMRDLARRQRSDGGWSQTEFLDSDAYATGQALVALAETGMPASDMVYQRGLRFLLRTQMSDGSWFVRSRTVPTQVYFESGFPHGIDQYISAAATNWSVQALLRAAMSGRMYARRYKGD